MPAPEPRQTTVALAPGLSVAAAIPRVLDTCAEDFERHRARLMVSDDPEGPHGARVALRRLRTALWAFGPLLRRRPVGAVAGEARRLFRLLGRLRDADVLAEAEAGGPAAAAMAARAAVLRAEVRAALADGGAEGFAARVAAVDTGRGWCRRGQRRVAAGPVETVAAGALDRAWAAVGGHGRRVAKMSVEHRHGFRKDLKSLRYLTDFFGPLWPRKRRERFLARLKRLQDALGRLNDLAIAEAQLGRSPARDAIAAEAMAEAERDWRRLRRSKRWW